MKRLDLRGQTFPHFSILQELEPRVEPTGTSNKFRRRRMYLCVCKCGEKFTTSQESIVRGARQSCGCLHRRKLQKAHMTHGLSKTAVGEYRSWCLMRTRYPLMVCEAWSRFDVFFHDMGKKPEGSLLVRLDPDAAFSKDNCKWATRSQVKFSKSRRAADNTEQQSLDDQHKTAS
jgi:hypothetical protein